MKDINKSDWKTYEQSVDTHLGILQSMIQRMAANSVSAKTWAVGLTTGTLFLGGNTEVSAVRWIALLPITSLLVLDIYYLTLEKAIRSKYVEFVQAMTAKEFDVGLLFNVSPPPFSLKQFAKAAKSPSILIFYVPLIVLCISISAALK